jgi:mannose-1-phosphate guanylyltransferase
MRRAMILAAGRGERLRPLTLKIPKCLLPVNGRAVLDRWLDVCLLAGVTSALVNTHHLADQVATHLARRAGPPEILAVHEETLLGSAGTLLHNRSFLEKGGPFAILYADTVAPRLDLDAMFQRHEREGALLTIGLFKTKWPRECGIAQLSPDGRIVAFEEKPARPCSDLANAGIYIADPAILDYLPETLPADIGRDLLPSLVGRMNGYPIDGLVLDIGTPERYREAQEILRDGTNRSVANTEGRVPPYKGIASGSEGGPVQPVSAEEQMAGATCRV